MLERLLEVHEKSLKFTHSRLYEPWHGKVTNTHTKTSQIQVSQEVSPFPEGDHKAAIYAYMHTVV